MTRKMALITDTASDLVQFKELFDKIDIQIIYLYILIGKETFTDETMTIDDLLKRMENATKETWPRTSQPPVVDFVEPYQKLKDEGYTDIISIHVASKLSGTMNSARLAAEEVDGINIYLVDSQMASSGIIPTILKVIKLVDQGLEPVEIQKQANEYALSLELYGTVPTLDNLFKGGRLKPIRYFLGRLLKFKPIIRMAHGELNAVDKTSNLEKTQNKTYQLTIAPYSQEDEFSLIISHAWAENEGLKFVEKFKKDFPGKKVYFGRVGPSMAVHLGKTALVFVAFPN